MKITWYDLVIIWILVSVAYIYQDNPTVVKYVVMFAMAFTLSTIIGGWMVGKGKENQQDEVDSSSPKE